tara:strand:- start:8186 stop:8908 length:723 start_codon:yes stop_codon:yes gene_type:complete
MRIAIIGYGKMGKTIEALALKKGYEIVLKTTGKFPADESSLKESKADVAIEFTQPDKAVKNLLMCAKAQIPVVTGTTGWYDHLSEVENEFKSHSGKLIYSSNFSIGVNIFFKLNEYLSRIMARYDSYDPLIKETHHTEKIDSPSGTAITLAEDIIFQMKRKDAWENELSGNGEKLSIISKREPNVPGTHEISYTGLNDELSIKHQANNRDGFALGSILAAKWLLHQESGVYSMRDFLKIK